MKILLKNALIFTNEKFEKTMERLKMELLVK